MNICWVNAQYLQGSLSIGGCWNGSCFWVKSSASSLPILISPILRSPKWFMQTNLSFGKNFRCSTTRWIARRPGAYCRRSFLSPDLDRLVEAFYRLEECEPGEERKLL